MTDPRTGEVPVTEVHDGAEPPLPEQQMPAEGTPVVLTRPVKAVSTDGLTEVELPADTPVTYQGHLEGDEHEVSAALIVHATVCPGDIRVDRSGSNGQ